MSISGPIDEHFGLLVQDILTDNDQTTSRQLQSRVPNSHLYHRSSPYPTPYAPDHVCLSCRRLKQSCKFSGLNSDCCTNCHMRGQQCIRPILRTHLPLQTSLFHQATYIQSSIVPTQQDVDQLFQIHLDSIAAKSVSSAIDIRATKSLSNLRRLCSLLDRLPSALYLQDVHFAERTWPQAVGGGSFSDVYMARKGDLKVAVKVLRTHQNSDERQRRKLRKNFISEALLWASCKHKYVLPFLGVDTTNFHHGMCMVLPWMDHGKILCKLKLLREENNTRGCKKQVDTWILHIAEGLAYLHSLGIIHGDLRAANVLLDENYNIKLSDFGLSLVADDIVTQATTIERTPNWIAPELLNPEKFGGNSSKPTLSGDVYAFGCVTIELYTGKPPYPGLQSYQVITKVLAAEPIPLPAFYNEPRVMDYSMWAIIERCLSQDSSLRLHAHDIPEGLRSLSLYQAVSCL